MYHFLLAILLFSGPVSAVSGRALADAFSYVEDPTTTLVSSNITRATTPRSPVLQNSAQVGLFASLPTYVFTQTIRIEGTSALNEFLRILPNMRRLRHITIDNITITFGPGQLRQLIQVLNEFTGLESLNLTNIQGLETGDLEQFRSDSLRQLTIESTGRLITVDFDRLHQNLPILRDLVLRGNMRVPQLSGSEFPNYTDPRVLRLWLINLLLQWKNRLHNADGRAEIEFRTTLIQHIQELNQEDLLRPVGSNRIQLIHLLISLNLFNLKILRRAIGDGQDPRLLQPNQEHNTLPMLLCSYHQNLLELLEPLIGDGTRLGLFQTNHFGHTLTTQLAREYGRTEERNKLIIKYLTRLLRNAPTESLNSNLAISIFDNIVRSELEASNFRSLEIITLFESLAGDGSRAALHQPGPHGQTLAGSIVRSLNDHPLIAARFLFPLLRHRIPVNDSRVQIDENIRLAEFLSRNFSSFTTEQQTIASQFLERFRTSLRSTHSTGANRAAAPAARSS